MSYSGFASFLDQEPQFKQFLDTFPYPIQVYSTTGLSVFMNSILIEQYGIDPSKVIGYYNVFEDPEVCGKGLAQPLKAVLNGETVKFTDIKVPLETVSQIYDIEHMEMVALYQDLTAFPLKDMRGNVCFFAVMMIDKRIYCERNEISKAKAYIEDHILEPFNLESTAAAVNLSKYHFTRAFKKSMGITPLAFYQEIKLQRLKCLIEDENISISEAFSRCGWDYSSYYAKLFKLKFGMSPKQYQSNIHHK